MASAATASNRFILQGTGDNRGTWGKLLNDGLIALVDAAIDGILSITLSGDVTLSSVNYEPDQARYRMLKFDGSGGTAMVPNVSKWYIVHNTCTAAATIKTATGVGAAVQSGEVAPVYCDGSDCFRMSTLWPLADGSHSAPGLYFASDTDTGFYRIAENTIGISIGGTTIAQILPTGLQLTQGLTCSGNVVNSLSVNGTLVNQLQNSNSGSAANCYFFATNASTSAGGASKGLRMGHRGTAQANYGALSAGAAYLYCTGGPLVLMADEDAGTIVFAAGGSAESGKNWESGPGQTNWRFGLATHNFSPQNFVLNLAYLGGGTQYGIGLRPQSDTTQAIVFSNVAGGTVGTISQTATATAYNTASDYRLKENIADLTGSGAFIGALRPRQFTWRATGERAAGFIAHEAAAVSPSSVTGERDATDAGGEPVYQMMQPASAEIIANLVAEVQALRARVAALEAR